MDWYILYRLNHAGTVAYNLTIFGSDNGRLQIRSQIIIWTNILTSDQ